MRFIALLFIPTFAFALPSYYVEKVDSVPNICESCYPDIVKWGGKPHCAPAAVSNSLVWLSRNGFPDFQPFHSGDRDKDDARLVNLLGEVMGTSEKGGTSPYQVLSGLRQYLKIKKIKCKRMASVGWRKVPDFVGLDDSATKLDWIKEGTLGKGSVWILIGWYKFNAKRDEYKIFDGHWMTVVGYGKDRTGRENSNVLILHDPAERAERKNYYATIVPLGHGTVDSRLAKDALSLSGDVILKPGADAGIIQGAYRLEF